MIRIMKISLIVMLAAGTVYAERLHSELEEKNKKENALSVEVTQAEVLDAGLQAAQKAGFKGNKLIGSKVKMTKEQEQAAAFAMENLSYPNTKQKILKKEKAMYVAKKCFAKANNISEATQCVRQIEDMGGKAEYQMKWNEKIKKEVLSEIDEFLNVKVPCAKKSDTADAYRKCREENK